MQHFIGSAALIWERREKGDMNLTFLECMFRARPPTLQMGKGRARIRICLTPVSSFAAFVMGGILNVVTFKLLSDYKWTQGSGM